LKTAYWGLAVIFFGLFGLLLISLFGDITVTNQQDYTLLKNSVEAAMYDSIDEVSYKKGFCICTNEVKVNDTYKFTNKSQYDIQTFYDDKTDCDSKEYKYCEKMTGEIKLNEEIFVESLLRRFAENVKGNKHYKIIIQEVIEYPPKVSVEIRAYSKYNSFESTSATFDEGDFDISNKIDSIFEYR